ncbi:transmembrane amino acid transporter protein-domain-containing protein [Coemansia spiralis]|nr:transmembrane amino acid transporter protein-domain-containing protein [Coemansia spiralis]
MSKGTGNGNTPPPQQPLTGAATSTPVTKLPQNARQLLSHYQNTTTTEAPTISATEHCRGSNSNSNISSSSQQPFPIRPSQQQQQHQFYSRSSPRPYTGIGKRDTQPININAGSTQEHGGSNSFSRATEILSRMGGDRPHSLSSSPAESSYTRQIGRHLPAISDFIDSRGNDSDSTTSSQHRKQFSQQAAAEQAEIVRRLKKHLVTRPTSSNSSAKQSPKLRYVSASPAASLPGTQFPGFVHTDDGGYAGDVNDDYDDGDPGAMPLEHNLVKEDAEETIDPFILPSGDITHQIYRWHGKSEAAAAAAGNAISISNGEALLHCDSSNRNTHAAVSPCMDSRRDSGALHLPRRRSFSGWESDPDWDIPYRSGQLNVPGGFRRQFVRERAVRQGRAPPGFITETFMDFIALYGHFAGGDYFSDDDEEYFDAIRGYTQLDPLDDDASNADVGATTHSEGTPNERTPLQRHSMSNLHAKASNRKAFFLIIKAFVGTGVLVLPRAFYNGGLLTSCLLMVAVACYSWHCILLLAEVYMHIGGGSYSDIGLRLYGRWMQYSVTSSIVLAQVGGCCAYTIFVAQNWRNVFNILSNCGLQLPVEFWVLIQMAVFIPLALIRQIRYFAPVALVANGLIIGSLSYLLGFDLWSITTNGPAHFVNYNPIRFPLLVGTAVYSFEGVTLVIPILDSIKEKRDFGKVLTLAIMLCLGLFLCVGSLSYLTFGERVEAVVLLNLPNESSWTILVQILYSVAILFSMPLQLFPAVKIMEAMMFTRSGREHKSVKWQKNAFRTAMALLIAVIAIFGADQLDNVVSLVGSFCLVPLSFIYPASMHFKAVAQSRWTRTKDLALVAIGIVAMVYVTFISLRTWGTSDPPVDMCSSAP